MKTFIVILTACFLNYLSDAQPGTLDKTFGDTGLVIGNYSAANTSVAMQKDGKFIAAGGINGVFLLARYNMDGSIDISFGKQGIVITNFPSGSGYNNSVAIQNDGKIVTTGQVYDFPYRHIALARYNKDGTLDATFGKTGLVDYSIAKDTNVYVTDAAIQSDGKMLVTGLAYADNYDYGYKSFIVRFTNEGVPDKSFGNKGEVFTTFTLPVEISSLAVGSEGNIFIGTYESLTSSKFTILKYLSNGFPDSSFGVSGIAKEAEYSSELKTIAIQKDGSIVAGGYIDPIDAPSSMKLVRFTNKGVVDSSFGKDGVVLTQFEEDAEVDKLLIQNDGKIVGAGTLKPGWIDASFKIVRYLPSGDIDTSFGTEGSTTTSSEIMLYCTDAILQNDGKILVAGETYTTDNNFAFARYINDDESKKQIIVTKIKRWLQHHNGLTWDNNSNISSYVVQRSYDGIHFSSLARINAGNNSNYTYQDQSPLSGNNYYRLQTASINGAVNYSNVIAITNDETTGIKMFPNPAKDLLNIQGLNTNMKYEMQLSNEKGKIVLSAEIKNVSTYTIKLNGLQQGVYYLSVSSNQNHVTTQKFLKE